MDPKEKIPNNLSPEQELELLHRLCILVRDMDLIYLIRHNIIQGGYIEPSRKNDWGELRDIFWALGVNENL
jgi:hypothetical protein